MIKLLGKKQYCMHCKKKTKIDIFCGILACSKCASGLFSRLLEIEDCNLNSLNRYEKELKKEAADIKKEFSKLLKGEPKELKKVLQSTDNQIKYELRFIKKLKKENKAASKIMFDIADLNAILDGNHIIKAFGPIRFVKDEIKRLRRIVKGCITSFYFPEKTSKLKQERIIEDFSKKVCPNGNIITTLTMEKGRRRTEVEVLLVY